MGLVPDGIAGVNTYAILRNLHNAWMDKPQVEERAYMGFARAADVLEHHAVCLFGNRRIHAQSGVVHVESRHGHQSGSKMVSAETLVPPDADMLLAHIVGPDDKTDASVPRVLCDDASALAKRISAAVDAARAKSGEGAPLRIALELLGVAKSDAAAEEVDRMAHHDAIQLLDAFCMAFS